MKFRSLCFLLLTTLPLPLCASADDSSRARDSLLFTCEDKPFVSVSATTPGHDGFPAVELVLKDPSGRVSGFESGNNPIPGSRYGNVYEMPERPLKSKARAVEVCDAKQGVYVLEIHELGSERYRLTASGSGDADNGDASILNHIGQKGRIRQYRFKFTIRDRRLKLTWLDSHGHEQMFIEVPEW